MLATHVFVGIGAASFWRGAWYILDDHLYPDDAVKSATASLGLGVMGLAASQGLVERAERLAKITAKIRPTTLAVARFGAIYTVATSCVLVWRATWVGWDVFYEYIHPHEDTKAADTGHATQSGILSHVAAVTMLLGTGLFASVLAPPAAISVIRDNSVRSATRQYTPPAQSMINQIFSGSVVRGLKSSSLPRGASRSLASANYGKKLAASSAYRGTKL